jgi:WD40 repeat protein
MTYRILLTASLLFSLIFPLCSQQLHIERIRTTNVNAPITTGAFNALQKSLAIVAGEKTVKILDVETLTERTTLAGIPSRVPSVMFGPDGRTTLSAMADGKVAVSDLTSNKVTKLLNPHAAAVVAMDLDRGSLLFTAGYDRVIKISDVTSGNSLGMVPAGQDEPTSLLVASSGEYFVAGTATGALKVYNLSNLATPRLITTGTERITKLAFNQRGNALLVGTSGGSLRILETSTWNTLHSSKPHAGAVVALGYEMKSRWFFTSGADSVVKFFDAASFKQIGMMKEGNGIGTFAAFVSDETFVVGTSKGMITTWNILDAPPDSSAPVIVLRFGADAREGDTLRHFGKEFRLEGHVYDQSKIKELRLNDTPISFVDLCLKEA